MQSQVQPVSVPAANAGSRRPSGAVTGDLLHLDSDPVLDGTSMSPFVASPSSSRRGSSSGMAEASAAHGRRGSRSAATLSSAPSMAPTGHGGGAHSGVGFTSPFASFADLNHCNAAINVPLPASPTTATRGPNQVALPPSPPLSSSGSGSTTPPNSSSRTNSSSTSAAPSPSHPPSSSIASARRRSSTPHLDPAPVTVTVPIPLAIPPKLVTAIQLSDEYIATYTKAADRAQAAGAALTVRVDHDDGDFVIMSACPKARKKMHLFLSQELAKVLATLPEQPLRRGSGGMGAGFPGGSPRMRPLSIMSAHSSHSAISSSGASGSASGGSNAIAGGHFLNQRHSVLAAGPSTSNMRSNVDPAVIAARKRANRMSIISAWSIPDDSDDDTTPLTAAPLVASGVGSGLASKPAAKPAARGFFSSTAPIPHSQWISSSPAAASANKATHRNSWLAVAGASPAEQPQTLTFADPPFANTAASSRPGFMAPPAPSQLLPPAPVPALAPPPSAVIAPNRPQGGYVHQVRGAGPRPTSMVGMGMFPPPPPPPSQSQLYSMSSR